MTKNQSRPGLSILKVAKDFGLNKCTVIFRLEKEKNGEFLLKVGRKCTFPTDQEKRLVVQPHFSTSFRRVSLLFFENL